MYKIDQKVSWICEGQTIVGRVFDIEVSREIVYEPKVIERTVYLLLEDGKHPRNGVSVRGAENITAV
jgi:hypothetical protein